MLLKFGMPVHVVGISPVKSLSFKILKISSNALSSSICNYIACKDAEVVISGKVPFIRLSPNILQCVRDSENEIITYNPCNVFCISGNHSTGTDPVI